MPKPNFLVIGGQKCGTTSLYHYLAQHPDVYVSPTKELRFFSEELDANGSVALGNLNIADFNSYSAAFDGADGANAIGEVSPSYLYYPGTAARIRAALPDVKLIAILRDPVDRAFSEYWHHWKVGRRLDVDFSTFVRSEALDAEPHVSDYQDCIRRGLYYRQLMPFYDHFARDRILVLLNDDLQANPGAVIERLFDFIDVDPSFRPDLSQSYGVGAVPERDYRFRVERLLEFVVNRLPMSEADRVVRRRRMRRRLTTSKGTVPPSVREQLIPNFVDDVHRLERLIDRDLSGWLR